jgi:hypothetical protein
MNGRPISLWRAAVILGPETTSFLTGGRPISEIDETTAAALRFFARAAEGSPSPVHSVRAA